MKTTAHNQEHRVSLLGVGLVLCLMITGSAHATSNVNVTLTGAGGAVNGLGPNFNDGEYLMPYYVSVNSATPIAVVCDDYIHTVNIGDHWTAAVSTYSDLSATRFGSADATQYHQAAWIASQITNSSSLADITGAQFAIWKLFYSGTPSVPGESTWIAMAQNAALNNYGGMDFSKWEVLTPVNPLSPQEYFFMIPEPSALLDLLMGLVAFGGISRWAVRYAGVTRA
jgi:hypothetical protein